MCRLPEQVDSGHSAGGGLHPRPAGARPPRRLQGGGGLQWPGGRVVVCTVDIIIEMTWKWQATLGGPGRVPAAGHVQGPGQPHRDPRDQVQHPGRGRGTRGHGDQLQPGKRIQLHSFISWTIGMEDRILVFFLEIHKIMGLLHRFSKLF